jgi:fructosamine-3-kinase
MSGRALAARIEALLGRTPQALVPLHGGCIAEVMRVELVDGSRVVVKQARGDGGGDLMLEAFMLGELKRRSGLPVPAVLAAEPDLLLLDYIEHDPNAGLDASAQVHAAELIAALHDIRGEAFGFERDTLIGPLPQPNPWNPSWTAFFRDRRLLHMTRVAREAGRLPAATAARLERLAARLGELIEEPEHPSLLHGDLWTGNVLIGRGRIAGFVDPAIYFGHPEIELAFATLFGTFGEPFFRRYRALRPLTPGFFEERRDLYNLYPLLVHVRLFGGGYLGGIERTLTRLGL